MITLVAQVRLRPVPPVRREARRMQEPSRDSKSLTMEARRSMEEEPVNCRCGQDSSWQTLERMRILVGKWISDGLSYMVWEEEGEGEGLDVGQEVRARLTSSRTVSRH